MGGRAGNHTEFMLDGAAEVGPDSRSRAREPSAKLSIDLGSMQQLQMSHLVSDPLVRFRKFQ